MKSWRMRHVVVCAVVLVCVGVVMPLMAGEVGVGTGAESRRGAAAEEQGKRAITVQDLMAMKRITDIQVSPDGKWVSYTVTTPNLEANKSARNVWISPVAGGEARQLTRSGSDQRARWAPDGLRIAFLSSRDGAQQVYVMNLGGGEAKKLTTLSTGADNVSWSPDGKTIAFTSEVYPFCKDDACNKQQDEQREKNPVKAHVYEELLYRHWTDWEDGKKSHLFVVSAEGGRPKDLTEGWERDVPPFSLGGPEAIAFSPDGKELCFVANTDEVLATSTNGDLFVVPTDGSAKPKKITTNKGYDGGPSYSPDGKWIGYVAQSTAGYESDKWRAMAYDRATGTNTNLSEGADLSVGGMVWTPDSKAFYFNAEWHGQQPVYRMEAKAGAQPVAVLKETYNAEVALTPDGKTLVVARTSMASPAEILTANAADGSGEKQITQANAALVAQLDLPAAEHYWFTSKDGKQVHGMLVRPPKFDAAKKYPVVMLWHGGPQTMWSDAWGYRWNPQVFASPGYAVLLINRRGSTGFGQAFVDEINADWGGKAYEDLMAGLDAALKSFPFLDGEKVAGAGASYGGFMADWMESQAKGRFEAIVSHAGVYNFESMYGATEELWFPEWDLRGTPWTNPETYAKQAPVKQAGEFGKYKTPTLVIAGEQDFRVPYTQSLEFFTALQRQGVPSKLVVFPDEGHWILKPQNAVFWYETVLGWLGKYLK